MRVQRLLLIVLGVVVALAAAGCFDPSVPVDRGARPQIACDDDADCPSAWLCSATLQRCIPAADIDGQPPALAGAATLTPAAGGAGQLFSLSFAVDEPLGADPDVDVDTGDGRAPWTLDEDATDRGANRYGYRYRATGNEAPGARPVTVALVDVDGSRVVDVSVGSVRFDFTAPRVALADASRSHVAAGVAVDLTVDVDEELSAPPALALVSDDGERHAATYVATSDGRRHGFSFSPTGAETEGSYAITATGADEAGNAFDAVLGTLTLDFTPPAIAAASTVPLRATTDQRVLVEIDPAEELASVGPLVGVATTGDGPDLAFADAGFTSGRLRFEHTVAAGTDGNHRLELGPLVDLAGNTTTVTVVGTLDIDTTAPAPLDVQTSHALAIAADTVVVTFATSEPLAVDPVVKLAAVPLRRRGTGVAPYAFELPIAGTNLVGTANIVARLLDDVGNEAVVSLGTVDIDAVPPRLLDVVVTPALARRGVEAILSVTTTEPLAATPTLFWRSPRGDPGFVALAPSGLSQLWPDGSPQNFAALDSV
jgi:hypothetical protein